MLVWYLSGLNRLDSEFLRKNCEFSNKEDFLGLSVADPDPPDPPVFGPPGSGSISQRYGSGSGSFYHHAKIVRKTLFSTILEFFGLFIFENDVNVPSKSKKQKIVFFYLFFVGILKVNNENSRIRIQDPDPDPLVNGMDPQIRMRIHT